MWPVRRGALFGALLTLAAAAFLVSLQPVGAAWWSSADPDGPYVGNSVNILLGNHTSYLDHPGLPTQDALAIAFGTQYLVERTAGRVDDREAFADELLLDLDRVRPVYRTWALLLFFGSALLVYTLVARLLGHWTWGVAGGVLFVSAPSLAAISFLLRPDNALAALCLLVGYLAATGFERRSAPRYTAAAFVLGFAMTVKLTAVGMIVPLVLVAVWRPPGPGGLRETASALARFVRRNALWLAPTAIAWLVLCWVFNRERTPILQTDDQRSLLVNAATFIGAYALFALLVERRRIPWADRVFRLSYAGMMVAFAAGLALPASLVLDDGIQMLVAIKETLGGGRVNAGVDPFAGFELGAFFRSPLSVAGGIIALGLAAGVVGAARRCWWPLVLGVGTLVLGTMAAARYSFDYYYAPAVALAIPGALWLFRRAGRPGVPAYLWLPVLFVFAWAATHQPSKGAWDYERTIDAAAQELADELVAPGEVVLVGPYNSPIEDVRFDGLVDGFADYVPRYPYRFLTRPQLAAEYGLTPAYYVALDHELPAGRTTVDVGGQGPFVIEKLPRRWGPHGEYGVARIVASPPLEP